MKIIKALFGVVVICCTSLELHAEEGLLDQQIKLSKMQEEQDLLRKEMDLLRAQMEYEKTKRERNSLLGSEMPSLLMVATINGRHMALLRGVNGYTWWVGIGDDVSGAKVVEIGDDHVAIAKKGSKAKVKIVPYRMDSFATAPLAMPSTAQLPPPPVMFPSAPQR